MSVKFQRRARSWEGEAYLEAANIMTSKREARGGQTECSSETLSHSFQGGFTITTPVLMCMDKGRERERRPSR